MSEGAAFERVIGTAWCACLVAAMAAAPVAVLAQSPSRADTLTIAVIRRGAASGTIREWVDTSGNMWMLRRAHDRQVGDSSLVEMRFDSRGLPTSWHSVTQNFYFDQIAEMRFWQSADSLYQKQGARTVARLRPPGTLWLVPFGAGELSDYLALRWVLLHPMDTLRSAAFGPVLPLEAHRVLTRSVISGRNRLDLTLFALSTDNIQSLLWLDADNRFVSNFGTTVVRADLAGLTNTLALVRDSLTAPRNAARARQLETRPAGGIAFVHANLIDVEAGSARSGTTVLMQGNKIIGVQPDSVGLPPGIRIIDAAGKSLMPGLMDLHMHLQGPDDNLGRRELAAGVTSIRDDGMSPIPNFGSRLHERRIDAGVEIGPRVLGTGGAPEGPGGGASYATVSTLADALKWVNIFADSGMTQISELSAYLIPKEWVRPIAAAAHRRGLLVVGHIPAFMRATQAIADGYDELSHLEYLMLDLVKGDTADNRPMSTYQDMARAAPIIDLNGRDFQSLLAALVAHHTAVDPTLVIDDPRGWPTAQQSLATAFMPVLNRMLLAFYQSHVRILAGTDNGSLARELEMYGEAGIPNAAVIRIATLGNAEYMRRNNDLGSIAAGKLADMILVDGNPLERLSALRRIALVVKDGVVYDTRTLLSFPPDLW